MQRTVHQKVNFTVQFFMHKFFFLSKTLDVFNSKMANRPPWLIMDQLFLTEVTKRNTRANPLRGT